MTFQVDRRLFLMGSNRGHSQRVQWARRGDGYVQARLLFWGGQAARRPYLRRHRSLYQGGRHRRSRAISRFRRLLAEARHPGRRRQLARPHPDGLPLHRRIRARATPSRRSTSSSARHSTSSISTRISSKAARSTASSTASAWAPTQRPSWSTWRPSRKPASKLPTRDLTYEDLPALAEKVQLGQQACRATSCGRHQLPRAGARELPAPTRQGSLHRRRATGV